MKNFLKDLFEYSHDANQSLWLVFNEYPEKTSEKAVKLYNHILNAHQVWNNRIEPRQNLFGVWEMHLMQECKEIDKASYEHSLLILDRFDLSEMISYRTTNGDPYSNNVREILFHVINHSTYHRGQIAAEFRQSGLEPLKSDYIFYRR